MDARITDGYKATVVRSRQGTSDACANCGGELRGAYCAVCGQKRLVEADRRFGHLLRQFVAAATDLGGRFWGSIRALLFQPGRLQTWAPVERPAANPARVIARE